jgi:manganese/zinc/iron transport system permease protein
MQMPTLFHFFAYAVRADDLWVIATAVASSVSCALLGCFLVLRRQSLLGDAISHAILPGLGIAFLLTNSRDPAAMLAGALVVGVLTAFFSSALTRWGKVPEDAAMGVVFSSMFALGVLIITWVASNVDLDPGCVLYGLIEFVPFDTVHLASIEIPRTTLWLLIILLVNITAITLFFKELKIVAFDPALATTMGINAVLVHYALMTGVAATSVLSFEAVGSILVVAMLTAPAASAHLLTDRLGRMLLIAAALATSASILGYAGAVLWNTSVAGMIAVTAGLQFLLAAFFAPRHGIVSKLFHQLALAFRIEREDVLGLLYRWHERARANPASTPLTHRDVLRATMSPILGRAAISSLRARKLLNTTPTLSLTPAGLARAAQLIQGHRLWESYLAKHLNLPADHLHAPSHRVEHFLTPAVRDAIGKDVNTKLDPHGREIPP